MNYSTMSHCRGAIVLVVAFVLSSVSEAAQVTISDFSCLANFSIDLLSLKLDCGEDDYCSFGEDVNVTAWMNLTDSTDLVYVDTVLTRHGNEKQLMSLEEYDLCNDAVSLTGTACPYDGSYEVTVPYTIPSQGTFQNWLTTGFSATADIDFYNDTNATGLLGSCECTIQTKQEAVYVAQLDTEVPIPSAAYAVLGAGAALFIVVIFALFRSGSSADDEKKKSLVSDDNLDGGNKEPDPIEAMRTRTFD